MKEGRESWLKRVCFFLVILAVVSVFILQVFNLHLAAVPFTDEGDHIYSAWMLSKGVLPYLDFFYLHPPSLPIFGAVVLKLTDSVYALRVLFLVLNCLSAVLLFKALRKVTRSEIGAAVGVLFYLTYSHMVRYDWRFLASRQLGCVVLIGYFFTAVCVARTKWRDIALAVLVLFGSLLSYTVALNLGALAFALLMSEKDWESRKKALPQTIMIFLPALISLLLFWAVVSGAYDQTVASHLSAPVASGAWRWQTLTSLESPDFVFFVFSGVGLLGGFILISHLRMKCAAMSAMIVLVFLPREFFPHYFVGAAPAFAFGIAALGAVLEKIGGVLKKTDRARQWVVLLALLPLLVWHESRVLVSLVNEWRFNLSPSYYERVKLLNTLPAPIMTFMNPIYAVEAKKEIVPHFYRSTMRFFRIGAKQPDWTEIDLLAHQACTVFLTPEDRRFIPDDLEVEWKLSFTVVEDSDFLILMNPKCQG